LVGKNSGLSPVLERMRGNRLFSILHDYGYRTVAFDASGWEVLRPYDVDDYRVTPEWGISLMMSKFVWTTPVPAWVRLAIGREGLSENFHRNRIRHVLSGLSALADDPGPFFVFGHVLLPHPPFLFREDGRPQGKDLLHFSVMSNRPLPQERPDYVEGYRDQLLFANRAVLGMVDTLLGHSKEPPIILIQSDHGSGLYWDYGYPEISDYQERFSNLMAFRFPDLDTASFYDSISPVNTFRIVLNKYFGAHYSPLPDHAYSSSLGKPLNFTDVTAFVK